MNPGRNEIPDIFAAMLAQYGLKLPAKKREYILRRLPGSIPALSEFTAGIQRIASVQGGKIDFSTIDACLTGL